MEQGGGLCFGKGEALGAPVMGGCVDVCALKKSSEPHRSMDKWKYGALSTSTRPHARDALELIILWRKPSNACNHYLTGRVHAF